MDKKITIYLTGDSTAARKTSDKRPETGWGEVFQQYFIRNAVIENRALNGRSTKSFIHQGHLAHIEKSIKPGDFLLIQFGHNDQKIEDPERGTQPYGDYQENLKKFVEVAVQKQATPILLTSVTRRMFDSDKKADSMSVGEYPKAMIDFARKNEVPLLDVHKMTREFMDAAGKEESKKYYLHLAPGESDNYPEGIEDNTHFNENGAEAVAELIVKALKESDLPIKSLLV